MCFSSFPLAISFGNSYATYTIYIVLILLYSFHALCSMKSQNRNTFLHLLLTQFSMLATEFDSLTIQERWRGDRERERERAIGKNDKYIACAMHAVLN